jgi:hypothetical protein
MGVSPVFGFSVHVLHDSNPEQVIYRQPGTLLHVQVHV